MRRSGRRHIIYWALNRDGRRSVVQRAIRTIVEEIQGTETQTTLNREVDYFVKIENREEGYRVFLTSNREAAMAGRYGEPLFELTINRGSFAGALTVSGWTRMATFTWAK